MKKFLLLVIVLLGILAGCTNNDKNDEYTGTVEGDLIPIQADISGKVIEIMAKEGDVIKEDQVLTRLDDSLPKISLQQAEAQLKEAQANLDNVLSGSRSEEVKRQRAELSRAEEQVKQTKAAENQAHANMERDQQILMQEEKNLADMQVLLSNNAVTPKEVELQLNKRNLAKIQFESSKAYYEGMKAQTRASLAQVTAAEAAVQLAVDSRTEPVIRAQEATVEQFQAEVAKAKLALQKLSVKSQVSGMIEDIPIHVGQQVSTGMTLFTVLDRKNMWVTVYAPENLLPNIHVGEKAKITIDVLPEKKLNGEIVYIAGEAEFTPSNVKVSQQKSTLVYAVKVQIQDGLEMLKPGMSAHVKFDREGT